jgi:hypothetical protein
MRAPSDPLSTAAAHGCNAGLQSASHKCATVDCHTAMSENRGSRSISEEQAMQFVCDAPPNTWFRIETEGEAQLEAKAMSHAVDKYFRQARDLATKSYKPPQSGLYIEQNIGLKAHVQRTMPLFITLRNRDGKPLVTAMLPPGGRDDKAFRPIVVGEGNADPYPDHGEAIRKLGEHFGMALDPARCFPYRRG